MKANEYKTVADFIKKNGLEAAKKQIEFAKGKLLGPVGEWRVEYLKQFVESHELVEKMGGLEKAKEVISGTENARFFGCDIGTAKYWVSKSNEYHICEYFFPNMSQQFAVDLGRLRKAIADVESCQPEQDIEQFIDEFRACGESGWSKYDDPVGEWLKEDRGE